MKIIELKNISRYYNVGTEKIYALNAVDLDVKKGEFISILGPSGSGKSTLMNIIGCMDRMDEGEYILDGSNIGDIEEPLLAKVRNEKIGFIFQKYHLIPRYTVIQNVMMPLLIRGIERKRAKEKAIEKLTSVRLEDRLYHRPNELSGGQQQRVAIARALVTEPRILLADEPTGALDSQRGKEILKLFKELNNQGNTIIMITHDKDVASYGERIVTIIDGYINKL